MAGVATGARPFEAASDAKLGGADDEQQAATSASEPEMLSAWDVLVYTMQTKPIQLLRFGQRQAYAAEAAQVPWRCFNAGWHPIIPE